jgi:hypothetical protein
MVVLFVLDDAELPVVGEAAQPVQYTADILLVRFTVPCSLISLI